MSFNAIRENKILAKISELTVNLLHTKAHNSSLYLYLSRLVCFLPCRKPQRLVFSRQGPFTVSVCLFVLLLYVPNQQLWSLRDGQFTLPHFFLEELEQAVNQYFVHILSLVTDNNPS